MNAAAMVAIFAGLFAAFIGAAIAIYVSAQAKKGVE